MEPLTHILLLEDDPADAELVQAGIEEAGLICRINRVQTRVEFDEALRQEEYDIILADFRLPTYDGMSALRLAQELRPDTEALCLATAEQGRALANAQNDSRRVKAASTLERIVQPDLDERFNDFFEQITSQTEDRAQIRIQAIKRHRANKASRLEAEIMRREERAREHRKQGEEKRYRTAQTLVEATRGKLRKLNEICDQRVAAIEAQRDVVPEYSQVSILFIDLIRETQ